MKAIQLALAPMEGLADFYLRQIITARGGYDYCVCEFIRVTNDLLPERVFYRMCPELHNGSKTLSGVPVHVQLLGSCPEALADNACRAAELGSPTVDLNFGCPSKTVNRHCGGAVLLKNPEKIFVIVAAIRKALPAQVPLTVKMRLGFDDKKLMFDNAIAAQTGGATCLTVHGRTKKDAYRKPAQWESIGQIKQHLNIPVVANGDINSPKALEQCRKITGCDRFMLGRGAVRDPYLANRIRGPKSSENLSAVQIRKLLLEYGGMINGTGKPVHLAGKIKQWMRFLSEDNAQTREHFSKLKGEKDFLSLLEFLEVTPGACSRAS